MNKLKEIGNKYYQEAEVVMLATEKSLKIGDLGLSANNILWNIKESNFKEADVLYECLPQHLYLLSNEQIKDDDWCIFMYDLVPKYGICKGRNIQDKSLAKKIIATTDTSLELPQPSKSFIQAYIKAYNENKPITKVLVEMERMYLRAGQNSHLDSYELKINSSNEITIKKVKDSWTREEHCTDMQYYMEYCEKNGYVTPMDWLDKFKHY